MRECCWCIFYIHYNSGAKLFQQILRSYSRYLRLFCLIYSMFFSSFSSFFSGSNGCRIYCNIISSEYGYYKRNGKKHNFNYIATADSVIFVVVGSADIVGFAATHRMWLNVAMKITEYYSFRYK